MQQIWDKTRLSVTLNQSLIPSLESFSQWSRAKAGKAGDRSEFSEIHLRRRLGASRSQGGNDFQVGASMRAQFKIWISIAASLAVSAVIAYFAFSLVREMSSDFARYQRYSAIINEAFALNILIDDALKQESNPRKMQQIYQVHGTLSKALASISPSNSREESLIRQIRRNNLELGPLIEQLFDPKEGSRAALTPNAENLLASQLWVKVRFITDDVNRLMETSGSRIIAAQTKTSFIVLILIGVAILSNDHHLFFLQQEHCPGSRRTTGESKASGVAFRFDREFISTFRNRFSRRAHGYIQFGLPAAVGL